jgi:hypothetical protein
MRKLTESYRILIFFRRPNEIQWHHQIEQTKFFISVIKIRLDSGALQTENLASLRGCIRIRYMPSYLFIFSLKVGRWGGGTSRKDSPFLLSVLPSKKEWRNREPVHEKNVEFLILLRIIHGVLWRLFSLLLICSGLFWIGDKSAYVCYFIPPLSSRTILAFSVRLPSQKHTFGNEALSAGMGSEEKDPLFIATYTFKNRS